MSTIKQNFRRIISIMCVLVLVVQTFIGYPGLLVSASDANKSDFQLVIENATYTSTYADSETAELALATATKQVQEVISARTTANENAATFVVNNPILDIKGKGGTYTFTVTVTLADSTSFTTDTLTMNVSARPEPLKVVFDNEETVNAAQFFNYSNKSLVTEGGKTFMRVEQDPSARPLLYSNFAAQAGVSSIDFDKYPYVRISWKNNDVKAWNSAFFYWGPTEGTESTFELYPYGMTGQDTDWKEVLFDMKAGQYTFLKGSGAYGNSDTCPTWTGEGLFNFTFSNSRIAFVGDIEYIAFFGSKAEAEAYPIELGSLKSMLETVKYEAAYAEAETVEQATALVTPQVQTVIDTWELDSGETATFTIKNGKLSRFADGGRFTFDVTVTETNSTPYDVSLTMTIGARPKPLVVVFDDADTVAGAEVTGASSVTFVNEAVDGGKSFMRMAQDSKEMIYENFVEQCGLSTMDFEQYPYLRLSFRSDNPGGYDEMQLYWFKDEGNSFYNYCPWKSSGGTDTDWKEVIFDMRTGAYDFKKGAGGYDEIVDQAGKNGSLSWTGEGTIRFDLCNYLRYRIVDLEYVAFFGSKAEAEAYPAAPDETVDQSISILSSTSFSCESEVASTKEDAHSEITKQIVALNLPATTYTLEQGDYIAPTTTTTGSYSVNVVFASGEKTTVTMMIAEAPIQPIVWTFDNKSILSQFMATNAGMTYEDGYVKMTTSNPDYDDGFFLEGVPKADEAFDISMLPYVKLKYKISGAVNSQLQFFYWLDNGNYYYHVFDGNDDPAWDGDTITVIANMSALSGQDAVWMENLTDNVSKMMPFGGSGASEGDVICEGQVTKLRFNLARAWDLDRTAEVEYIGFFPTYEAAAAYDGEAQERVNAAVEYLNEQSLEMRWADGSAREKAIEGAKLAIEQAGVGCTDVVVEEYVEPTTTTEGRITCQATLKSAEVSATVSLTISIGTKPSEPIVWRFNDPEYLKKFTFSYIKATIEDNVAKFVSTNPTAEDGFFFFADTPGASDPFYLENYPYIRLKYKREGVAPGQLYFYSDVLTGNPNLGVVAYGKQSGDWYTSIVDTVVRSYEIPMVYSYNHATGETEEYIRNSKNGLSSYTWRGLSSMFRFNFGRRANLDRTMYLEYIAFFPTLEDARAYDEDNERLKANAQLALKSFTGSNVSFYEGFTETDAKATASDLISTLVGDEVKVVINKVAYTAPENTTNGSYRFTADIRNLEDKVLYTTSEYTLTISYQADTDPVAFTFRNPAFISRVKGLEGTSVEAKGYTYMALAGDVQTSFALSLSGTEKFHMQGHPYIALKVNANTNSSYITLNGVDYNLGNIIQGETVLVIDTVTGKVYANGSEVRGITLSDVAKKRIVSLGMKFAATEANVYHMAFFATLQEAKDYTGTSEVLQQAVNAIQALSLKCAYADAKTQEEAMAFILSKISAEMGTQVSLVSTECLAYTDSNITVRILIGAGTQSDAHYGYVEVSMAIGTKPSAPVVWSFTPEFVSTLAAGGNAALKSENNVLIMDTTNHTAEDGYFFIADGSSVGDNFYLQDYPYIKIKYRYHTYGNSTGESFLYFNNNETDSAYRAYSIGSAANNDIWCSALLDMNANTITLCDLENNKLLSSTSMSGPGAYHGEPTSFRVTMGRRVNVQRHAEIEYIAFFSSREEAEAYNNDYYYSAYNFNGVEYAEAQKELYSAPQTIETVINPTTGQNTAMTILSNKKAGNDNYYALETTANGNVRFVYNGSEVLLSTNVNVYDGKWHQVAVTLSNGKAVLYVDEVVVATNTSFALSNAISLEAPVIANDYVGTTQFVGNIYYVRLYHNAQTANQLASSAFNKTSADAEALLAAWFMDKLTNDGQFADVCGSNPMTLMDNYDHEGHEFSSNDYVKTEKLLTAEPQTFEFWMKSPKEDLTGTYTILSNKTDGSTAYTEIKLINGQLQMIYNGATLFTTTGTTFSDNIWKHVAITLGDTTQLYIDGELAATYQVARTTGTGACNAYYIGAGLESEKTPFVGKLSDVRIWSSVRTQEMIQANMQDYLAEATAELLGSWRLDMQTYLEYTDYSTNANTGTLYSAGWYKLENITGDYTIGTIGDTQSYMLTIPTKFVDTFEALSEKIDEFNMKYIFHLGDVTQNDTLMEWRYARQAFDLIEGKLPYSIVLGNHDYPSPSSGLGGELRDSTNYNEVFPVSTFENQEFKNSWFGGTYDETDSTNIYSFLNVGDTEYIIFSLECGPRDEILEWVSKTLNRYSEKCAIILTHAYFNKPDGADDHTGELSTTETKGYSEDFATANDGQEIWDELLSKHDNIGLLLCGHSQNQSVNYTVTEGDYGNDVVQLMVDHSAMITGFPSQEGLMTLLSFDEKTGAMRTYWYSPLYDMYYSTSNEVTFDMSDTLVKKDRKEYYEELTIDTFRSGDEFSYPKSEEFGYIFAGWYDVETKEPIADTVRTGRALAKFVDADILEVKVQAGLVQTDAGNVVPDDNASLRFVTTIDELDYKEVAFMISLQTVKQEDGTYTYTEPKSTVTRENAGIVYEKLYYVGMSSGETMKDYAPNIFSNYSRFFKTYTLSEIPRTAYDTNIRVTPYWETLDGTTVYGKERIISVNDVIDAQAK